MAEMRTPQTEPRTDGTPSGPLPARRGRSRIVVLLLRSRSGLYGLVIVVLFVAIALLAPVLSPHDPFVQDLNLRLMPPFWQSGGAFSYPLGTDPLGRDILSRILYGSRVSLLVGVATVAVGSTVGIFLGMVAAYQGGALDNLVMRLADVQLAFPSLILAIAVMAILGPGLWNIIIVLSITSWVTYARIARGETLSLRAREFILAAQTVGVSKTRILLLHILPNILPVAIVVASFAVAQVIIAEASLSFLGIGVPPPTPTWGNMLAEGRDYVTTAWWLPTFPGVALMITLLGINLLGDWLRDVLDPRLKNL
jgi:peptide/nickel transport system permease protein